MFGNKYVADKIACIISKLIEIKYNPVEPITPMGFRPDLDLTSFLGTLPNQQALP